MCSVRNIIVGHGPHHRGGQRGGRITRAGAFPPCAERLDLRQPRSIDGYGRSVPGRELGLDGGVPCYGEGLRISQLSPGDIPQARGMDQSEGDTATP